MAKKKYIYRVQIEKASSYQVDIESDVPLSDNAIKDKAITKGDYEWGFSDETEVKLIELVS